LLRSRGLEPSSTLLDIGCGPLRAGVHFIRYLDSGNYFGFDYNTSFVAAAQQVVADNHLADKRPSIVALADFDFGSVNRRFDFAIAFSVLNHCSDAQRKLFFMNIGRCLVPGAKLFISHARWLAEADLVPARLVVLKRFEVSDLDLGSFGWPVPEQRSVCPLFELGKLPD
jgi:cyclopropane fatty-acyl-phospholipid synthase-like methyltransferase